MYLDASIRIALLKLYYPNDYHNTNSDVQLNAKKLLIALFTDSEQDFFKNFLSTDDDCWYMFMVLGKEKFKYRQA